MKEIVNDIKNVQEFQNPNFFDKFFDYIPEQQKDLLYEFLFNSTIRDLKYYAIIANLFKIDICEKDPSIDANNLPKDIFLKIHYMSKNEMIKYILKIRTLDVYHISIEMLPLLVKYYMLDIGSDNIYDLSLSNTQSRRSRAGKEFEAIIELILIGADIPLDSQGNIGKKLFTDKGLGKLVDVVSPGVMEYLIDKNDTVLISAKTTLRERWQEVPEEVSRTGANSMYLITLDDSVSQNVLDELYEANVILTTIESVKEKSYKDNKRVMTFEQLIKKCKDVKEDWEAYLFSDEQKDEIITSLEKQQAKHTNHDFVLKYYAERLVKLMNK